MIGTATSLDQPADIGRDKVHKTRDEVRSNLGSHRNDGPVNLTYVARARSSDVVSSRGHPADAAFRHRSPACG